MPDLGTRTKLNLGLRVFILTTAVLSAIATGSVAWVVFFSDAGGEGGGSSPPSGTANLIGYYYYSNYSTPLSTSPSIIPTEAFYKGPGSSEHGLRAEYFRNYDLS